MLQSFGQGLRLKTHDLKHCCEYYKCQKFLAHLPGQQLSAYQQQPALIHSYSTECSLQPLKYQSKWDLVQKDINVIQLLFIAQSVLLENTSVEKFLPKYIHDPDDTFSIIITSECIDDVIFSFFTVASVCANTQSKEDDKVP